MTTTKTLMDLNQSIQAASLVKLNLNLAKKKKKGAKDFIKVGTTNLVGIELLKAQAHLAAGL